MQASVVYVEEMVSTENAADMVGPHVPRAILDKLSTKLDFEFQNEAQLNIHHHEEMREQY